MLILLEYLIIKTLTLLQIRNKRLPYLNDNLELDKQSQQKWVVWKIEEGEKSVYKILSSELYCMLMKVTVRMKSLTDKKKLNYECNDFNWHVEKPAWETSSRAQKTNDFCLEQLATCYVWVSLLFTTEEPRARVVKETSSFTTLHKDWQQPKIFTEALTYEVQLHIIVNAGLERQQTIRNYEPSRKATAEHTTSFVFII